LEPLSLLMTIRELLSQMQTTFADAGVWFADLSCRFGLSPNCVYSDWKELTIGQAAFVSLIAYAGVRLLLDKLALRKFLAFFVSLAIGAGFVIGEIYLVELAPAPMPGYVSAFPINVIFVFLCIVMPFLVAGLTHTFVLNRLTRSS
jgi:hypothetical protein